MDKCEKQKALHIYWHIAKVIKKKNTQVKYKYLNKKPLYSYKVFVLDQISSIPAGHFGPRRNLGSKELLKDYTAHKQQALANKFSRALFLIQRDDVP